MATFTQLSSFLFTLTYPLFIILSWAICHLPWQIASPGRALSLPEVLFSVIVISPSYPVLPRLPCFVLTKLLCLRTTWVYPSPPLQMLPPKTFWVLPYNTLQHHLLMQHSLMYYLVLSRLSTAYIPSCVCVHTHKHKHTQILTNHFIFVM